MTRPAARLTHAAALIALQAAVAHAEAIGVPEVVAVVDADGNLLAFLRMDGAKLLSRESALAKAVTAASNGAPTGGLAADLAVTVGLATGGRLTNLPGGLPIVIDGACLGGIGVGSGASDQDVAVARAALRAIGAQDPVTTPAVTP
ncbi:heme-binding protein [Methylobacterium sp. WL7]|uniref:GlcG/HbpS family heme-binding protein n=1 Tax=Methylobacterium sp. WL7 TaxID=2603900 RepID=UPI0011CC608E|nr:heme-binding protein [Methylobacterium sp. WL7]TXN39207.1 heme-binding protein [Methylobacterium sp. WL7]